MELINSLLDTQITLGFIYFFFSIIIFHQMFKENQRLAQDKEELIKEIQSLRYEVEDLMERFVPK